MDVTVWNGYLLNVVVFLIPVVVRQTECQAYSWIGSSTLIPTILPCNNVSTQLEFNWTYKPETPVPTIIEWSIRNSGGTFDTIATFTGGSLTISQAYASRFIRTGATAEYALKNPTTSDVGFYTVSVFDSGGGSIDGVASATEKYVAVSTISSQCIVDGGIFTMTCSGTDQPDVPAKCMKLRKNDVNVPGRVKDGQLSDIQDDIDNETITCSLCGVMSQCLPEPSSFICPDCRPCNKSGIAFLVITLVSLVIGIVAIIVVKMCISESLRLAMYIVGAAWIVIGLIGTITVLVICAQVQPGDVLPCGSMTIASVFFCVITLLGGVVTICLACCVEKQPVPDDLDRNNHSHNENPRPLVRSENQYDFNHKSRGVALILCNKKFEGFSNTAGADHDVRHFKQTFAKLGFSPKDIRVRYNMTVGLMLDWFLLVSKEDHTDTDCLIVAISSYGDEYTYINCEQSNVTKREDIIYGTDKVVFTRDLVDKFRDEHCPSLAGKPRIFFLQACRGTKLDEGVEIEEGMDVADAPTTPQYTVSPTPCFKDFCIVYATPPGHFAFCRPSEGSFFVKVLWDVVSMSDPAKTNFHKLITMVIRKVALYYQSSSDAKKQSGRMCSMLTKDVYFTDRNTPPISPHPQDQPPKPIVTATTDVTSSQPVNSSSSQGRPSLGPVQSSRGPKSQARNASLGDSENPDSSRVTSASNVNAQLIVQHEATQQGEGNQTEKQKSKKKKKKNLKVS